MAKAFKMKKLSKKKKKEIKGKLWQSIKDITKNANWVVFALLMLIEFGSVIFGKDK